MRSRLVVFLILAVGAVFALLFARQAYRSRDLPREGMETPALRLLTYDTFMSSSGPGREIIKRFESEHGCQVEVTTSSDAGLLLERAKMGNFDVVLGFDQMMLGQAKEQFKWRVIEAFDWSPMSFVYRKDDKAVPLKFDDLLSPNYKGQMALQDPKASSPGLQFVQWVRALKGDQTEKFLTQFKPNVQSISPSWQFSYGLFEKGQVRFVFSYLTSLAYHWGVQKDRSFQILSFPEGHPSQTEYLGVLDSCRECELATAFYNEILSPVSQKTIMEKNFMFPVDASVMPNTIYSELPELKLIDTPKGKDLGEWEKVFNH